MELFKLIKKLTKYTGSHENDPTGVPASNSYINRLIRYGNVKIDGETKNDPNEIIEHPKTVKVGARTLY